MGLIKVVIKLTRNKYAAIGNIEDSYKALRDYVGGHITALKIRRTSLLIISDEGARDKGKQPNVRACGRVVYGDLLIAALDGNGNLRSLTHKEIHKALDFIRSKRIKRGGFYEKERG